jgi:hypothetical protein
MSMIKIENLNHEINLNSVPTAEAEDVVGGKKRYGGTTFIYGGGYGNGFFYSGGGGYGGNNIFYNPGGYGYYGGYPSFFYSGY